MKIRNFLGEMLFVLGYLLLSINVIGFMVLGIIIGSYPNLKTYLPKIEPFNAFMGISMLAVGLMMIPEILLFKPQKSTPKGHQI